MTEVKSLLSSISNVYIGNMPTTPDDVVAIYNTGGYPRGLTESKLEELTFQVKVRHVSYAATEILCSDINNLLHGASTSKILMIQSQSGVLDLGRNENNLPEMSMNFRCYYLK